MFSISILFCSLCSPSPSLCLHTHTLRARCYKLDTPFTIDAAAAVLSAAAAATVVPSAMEKTKCAVIQDDILAVKHAMANGLAFEGLEGKALNELLLTLQAQRAEVMSGGLSKAKPRPAKTSPHPKVKTQPIPSKASRASATVAPPVAATPPPSQAKKSGAGSSRAKPASKPTPKTPKSPQSSQAGTSKRPAPATPPSSSGGGRAQKAKKNRYENPLRLLRKAIKVGDVVSVLMDLRLSEGWTRSWVRGEITREVSERGCKSTGFNE